MTLTVAAWINGFPFYARSPAVPDSPPAVPTGTTSASRPSAPGEEGQGMRCEAQYAQNPDRCYLQFGHRGPHSNRYGTTWTDTQTTSRRNP